MTTVLDQSETFNQATPPAEEPTPAAETNGHAEAAEPVTGARRARKARAEAPAAEPAATVTTADIVEQIRAARDIAINRREELLSELAQLDEQLAAVGVSFPQSDATPAPTPRVPTHARPAVHKAAPAPAKRAAKAKADAGQRVRRTNADIEAGAAKIVAHIKKAGKDGVSAIGLREALHIEKKHWGCLIRAALESGALKQRGQKRSTTYIAA